MWQSRRLGYSPNFIPDLRRGMVPVAVRSERVEEGGSVPAVRWVWVFGDVEGLRWVLQNRRMAFTGASGRRASSMKKNDDAILYVSRGAFHNPTRDYTRLAGYARILGTPRAGSPVSIAGREYCVFVDIKPVRVLPEREGPEVRHLARRLQRVKRPEVWGQYFRGGPLRLSERDFRILKNAVDRFSAGNG